MNGSMGDGHPIPEDARIKNRGRYGKYWDKTANVKRRRAWYGWTIFLGLLLVVLAVVDIVVLDSQAKYGVLGLAVLLILVAILLFFTRTNQFARVQDEAGSLEQALLQCPECKNIFEMKQQHFRGHQRVAFSCPVCGTYGQLPGIDQEPVKKRLPDGDLREYQYHCTNCQEDIHVGVFGEEEIHRSEFRACPNCGQKGTIEVRARPDPLPQGED